MLPCHFFHSTVGSHREKLSEWEKQPLPRRRCVLIGPSNSALSSLAFWWAYSLSRRNTAGRVLYVAHRGAGEARVFFPGGVSPGSMDPDALQRIRVALCHSHAEALQTLADVGPEDGYSALVLCDVDELSGPVVGRAERARVLLELCAGVAQSCTSPDHSCLALAVVGPGTESLLGDMELALPRAFPQVLRVFEPPGLPGQFRLICSPTDIETEAGRFTATYALVPGDAQSEKRIVVKSIGHITSEVCHE